MEIFGQLFSQGFVTLIVMTTNHRLLEYLLLYVWRETRPFIEDRLAESESKAVSIFVERAITHELAP